MLFKIQDDGMNTPRADEEEAGNGGDFLPNDPTSSLTFNLDLTLQYQIDSEDTSHWFIENAYWIERTIRFPFMIKPPALIGDVNEDGQLNILDVVYTVNLILDGEYNELADVGGGQSEVIEITDVVAIINNLLAQHEGTSQYEN